MAYEEIFLIVLALAWIAVASIQDLRKREVANWLNFSFIIFALVFRMIYSVISLDYSFILYGLIGLGIFFVIANLFYYSRVFAGGDAKLLMGVGVILPLFSSFKENAIFFSLFIILLLFSGGIYSIIYSFFLALKNKEKFYKEFKLQSKKWRKIIIIFVLLSIVSAVFSAYLEEYSFLVISLVIFIFPFLFLYSKSVENSCMIKMLDSKDVTIGDWLYEKINIKKLPSNVSLQGKTRVFPGPFKIIDFEGSKSDTASGEVLNSDLEIKGRVIEPHWEGLTEEEVKIIRKSKEKIAIKQGIPFVPAFFIAFLALVILRYSSWSFFKNLF
ncbi:prepilin peptidase [Candidatus Pacearchaeota archaeon]|nr:prepilin peptidase [Candidatus Pacearchaeota archaeon]